MKMIKYYPNIKKSINIIDLLMITEPEHQKIKKISKTIRETIQNEINENINLLPFIRYYVEKKIDILDTNFSSIEKELIISNVILPNDIHIADLLNKNGYTKEFLKSIIKTRQKIKLSLLNNIKIDNELQTEFDEYKQNIIPIIELFKKEYNITDINIILNKICEISTKYPNYFESNINIIIKKRWEYSYLL